MSISIQFCDGPLPRGLAVRPAAVASDAAGADICFEGIVRALENGHAITALHYEIYEPMATRALHFLASEVVQQFGLIHLHAAHSRGRVPVGQCSFRLRIAAAHRAEALHAMAVFIDRLKRDVPIWKSPVNAAGNPLPAGPGAAASGCEIT